MLHFFLSPDHHKYRTNLKVSMWRNSLERPSDPYVWRSWCTVAKQMMRLIPWTHEIFYSEYSIRISVQWVAMKRWTRFVEEATKSNRTKHKATGKHTITVRVVTAVMCFGMDAVSKQLLVYNAKWVFSISMLFLLLVFLSPPQIVSESFTFWHGNFVRFHSMAWVAANTRYFRAQFLPFGVGLSICFGVHNRWCKSFGSRQWTVAKLWAFYCRRRVSTISLTISLKILFRSKKPSFSITKWGGYTFFFWAIGLFATQS